MQEKLSIMTIAAVITAVFTTTLVTSLTVQPAAAVCSPRSGACADNVGGVHVSTGPTTNAGAVASNTGIFGGGNFAQSQHPFSNANSPSAATNEFGCGGKPGVGINHHPALCAG